MNLYILRHGIAVERGTHGYALDRDRPLTPEGRRKLARIAGMMKTMKLTFDAVLSSPYVRAHQTAEIVAKYLGLRDRVVLTDALGVEGNPRELIADICRKGPALDSVLLVGHEPYLSGLISMLLSGRTDLTITLKKGGLCHLGAKPLKYGRCATLEWLLTPKQMARMK